MVGAKEEAGGKLREILYDLSMADRESEKVTITSCDRTRPISSENWRTGGQETNVSVNKIYRLNYEEMLVTVATRSDSYRS